MKYLQWTLAVVGAIDPSSPTAEGFFVARDTVLTPQGLEELKEKIRHLQKVDIFADCTKKQLKAVAAISRVVEVPTGTMLTRVGETGEEFFFILDGSAMHNGVITASVADTQYW